MFIVLGSMAVVPIFFFFFNDTATTEIYTLSLHDALPISFFRPASPRNQARQETACRRRDRKSTRLNSSHTVISYAVFCLKKKKKLDQLWRKKKKKKIHEQQQTSQDQL